MTAHDTDSKFDCDLLVAGSGAAGLAAAVTAAHRGLRVIVAEKAAVLGGTSALSGGWIWAPCNPVAQRHGINEAKVEVRRYLEAVLAGNFNPELVDAFLDAAPEMVDFFERETSLQFDCGAHIPDTYGEQPGAGTGGRSVIAKPYDGRKLGQEIALLRAPIPETSFLGMTIQAGPDLRAFMTVTRSLRSAVYVGRRLGRHMWDLARYGRGMQLRNGNALVARLLRSALDLDVTFLTEHEITELRHDNDGVRGAALVCGGKTIQINSKCGVVLACGGYPHDLVRRTATFPRPERHLSLAVDTATGDGLRIGESVGGKQDLSLAAPGAWCPVSEVTWPNGSKGAFPHIIDRGKPGVIGVLANGRRFCNEGLGYHDYVTEMLEAVPEGDEVASWLVCDRHFLKRYGLGVVRPAPVPYRKWQKSGYLKTGRTIEDLARACGIDAQGLAATVAAFNESAGKGEDPNFGRGTTPYMRLQGDPEVAPNPCVAP
ncbi:MAG TPA: FAD-dependent oxidoreductase, partial [Paracoccaceae bacterium]|nr:FAD-dependent oxidoreductase [Paracoccaceae bacterium]